MMPIYLERVSKSFARKAEVGTSRGTLQRREVLKDVTLEIGEGQIVCVLGRNGSGKTTLLRILSTLIEPDRGQVRVCGFDVLRESREVRRRIGVMLNAGEGGFHHRLSGSENLEYYSALYKIPMREARARVRHLLNDLELADRGSDQYQSYSSGMRRRLSLARSLLPNAPVLLLDEPTLGVDPWSTVRIHGYIGELSKQGKTVLCTTNSITEANALSQRVHVLENGSLSPLQAEGITAA